MTSERTFSRLDKASENQPKQTDVLITVRENRGNMMLTGITPKGTEWILQSYALDILHGTVKDAQQIAWSAQKAGLRVEIVRE